MKSFKCFWDPIINVETVLSNSTIFVQLNYWDLTNLNGLNTYFHTLYSLFSTDFSSVLLLFHFFCCCFVLSITQREQGEIKNERQHSKKHSHIQFYPNTQDKRETHWSNKKENKTFSIFLTKPIRKTFLLFWMGSFSFSIESNEHFPLRRRIPVNECENRSLCKVFFNHFLTFPYIY